MGVVFVDTETTGLDPWRHEIWEIALIEENGKEHLFYPVLSNLEGADLIALNIGGWFERAPQAKGIQNYHLDNLSIAEKVMKITWGEHLVGAIPSFDAERLTNFLRSYGLVAGWHYHLIDVEALAIGYMRGHGVGTHGESTDWSPPYKSDEIIKSMGIDRDKPEYTKHTAMGDARLAREVYYQVMGNRPQ